MLPDAIIDQYNLRPLFHNGYVYVEIRRGMYGLPQAGCLVNDQLIELLAPHRYCPEPLTPGLWRRDTRDIVFSLVVDDFGVRYTSRDDADHLLATLATKYQLSTDWTGARYCELTLKWDFHARTCDVSMPGYIERTLQRFQLPKPTKLEHSPHPWQKPNYGAKTQYAILPDDTDSLDAANKTRILGVLGTLLFYALAIDSTLLTAIGELSLEQSEGTKTTMEKLSQLLNFLRSSPRRHRPLHNQRHDSRRRKQRFLFICCQSPLSGCWVLLSHQCSRHSPRPFATKRRRACLVPHHAGRPLQRCRSQTRRPLSQWQRSLSLALCPRRNGPSTTRNANGNRQQRGQRYHNRHCKTETVKSY